MCTSTMLGAGECSNQLSEVAIIAALSAILFVDEPPVGAGFPTDRLEGANALIRLPDQGSNHARSTSRIGIGGLSSAIGHFAILYFRFPITDYYQGNVKIKA